MAKDKYEFSNTPQPGGNPDSDRYQFGLPQNRARTSPGCMVMSVFGLAGFAIIVALISLWKHG